MTQDDEEFMLDNFVTFFIAGEFLFFLLWCVEKKIFCVLRKDLSNRCSRLKRLLESRGVLIATVNRKLEILDRQRLDVKKQKTTTFHCV